jgi:uncharacterized repeat protein (TIGR01451 family)
MPRLLLLVVVLLFMLVGLAAGPTAVAQNSPVTAYLPIVTQQSTPNGPQAIRLSPDDYEAIGHELHPELVLDYGSFIWLIVPSRDLIILQQLGILFEHQEAAFELLLSRFRFDPLDGEPELPPDQQTSYAPGEEGFYLVQFVGPVRDEWLAELEAAGVLLIQFQPSFAYIVRMTPEVAASVETLSFVRWVGVYHAAYRIAPTLLQFEPIPGPSAPLQLIENVDVTIYNDGRVEEMIAAIENFGGRLVDQFSMSPDESLVTAIFALPAGAVVDVAQLNTVLWLNHRPPIDEHDDEMSAQIIAGNFNPLNAGYLAWLASKGVNGTGVIVGLVDSGYDTGVSATAHNDVQGRLIPVGAPVDTNGHGTHVGGIMIGNAALGTADASGFLFGLGVAPNATMVVRTSTGADNARTRDIVVNGGVTSNHSYSIQSGSSGYTARDRTYDILVRDADQTTAGVAEPLIIVFSAGNCGNPASLPGNCGGNTGPTKEAKNVIAVGNSLNQRNGAGLPGIGNINALAAGSSRGPAQDGRTYPHVAAPGTNIISTRSTQIAIPAPAGTSCAANLPTGAPGANPTYSLCSGTSMAAPHVTGAVALLTEWWRSFNAGADPSPAMAKALLINGATDMGTADIPNSNEGWGRINLDDVIVPPVPTIYLDQTTVFGSTGETWSLSVGPADPTQPLKVSLVWSDAPGPGSGGATAAWVNDLDLTVGDGTTTFVGNVFANGWSVAGGAADGQNNAENVFIQNPGGPYQITISAANIAGNGVPGNADLTDQDFALVCFNCATEADLELAKSDSPDPVIAGTQLTYVLDVTNNGPDDTSGVVVTDLLPPQVTFDPLLSSPSCSEAAGVVTCTAATLSSGASVQFTLVVDVHPATPAGTVLTNTADVTSNVPDPDMTNNSASEDTHVIAVADLEIVSFEAVDAPAQIMVGEDVDIVLRKVITNNGPSGPMDTQLTINATAPPDSTATPAVSVIAELALGIGEMREVFEMVTINCGQASQHTFTFTNEIEPLNPADTDPDLSNNFAELELDVECVVPVALNIKPGSFPNSINPNSRDVIPLAILTTVAGEYGLPLAFDATTIDPLSVRFGPPDVVWDETGGAFEAHNRGHIEDSLELDEVTRDGDLDMVLHFHVQETGIGPGDTEACVKGQWIDGNGDPHTFFGCDSVRIVPSALP